mgnify:CR=1 FL=1
MLVKKMMVIILFFATQCFGYSHQMQISTIVAKSYDQITGSYYYPINGTQKILLFN